MDHSKLRSRPGTDGRRNASYPRWPTLLAGPVTDYDSRNFVTPTKCRKTRR